MDMHELTRELKESNTSRIVMLVADGLGGLPARVDPETGQAMELDPAGKTELETARTPNLDALARRGVCGLSTPVAPGITPGSGPGHLGLFGYDPLRYSIGRGVLEALGIDFVVGSRDVAIRGNFCTVDSEGNVTDRRQVVSRLKSVSNSVRSYVLGCTFLEWRYSSNRCANTDW